MKVSIFRVETPRGGCGPYKGTAHFDELEEMYAEHGQGDHPSPDDDPMLGGMYEEEHCGFATLDALDQWFEGYHELLDECGYIIACYTVPLRAVRYGNKQAVFRRADIFPSRSMPMR